MVVIRGVRRKGSQTNLKESCCGDRRVKKAKKGEKGKRFNEKKEKRGERGQETGLQSMMKSRVKANFVPFFALTSVRPSGMLNLVCLFAMTLFCYSTPHWPKR